MQHICRGNVLLCKVPLTLASHFFLYQVPFPINSEYCVMAFYECFAITKQHANLNIWIVQVCVLIILHCHCIYVSLDLPSGQYRQPHIQLLIHPCHFVSSSCGGPAHSHSLKSTNSSNCRSSSCMVMSRFILYINPILNIF